MFHSAMDPAVACLRWEVSRVCSGLFGVTLCTEWQEELTPAAPASTLKGMKDDQSDSKLSLLHVGWACWFSLMPRASPN